MFTELSTADAFGPSSIRVNPVSAIPVDSEGDLIAPDFTFDEDAVLAGPGESNPYYTVDHLSKPELITAFYSTPRAELPAVADCPFREFEAMAVAAIELRGIEVIRELAALAASPLLADSYRTNPRLAQAKQLADAYFAVADLVSYDDYTGNDAEGIAEGLREWASAVAVAPKPMRPVLDQLAERASGVADRADRVTGEDAPLVSVLNGTRLAIALYLSGIALPEAGVPTLDTYEDLARASVAVLGAETVIELEAGLRFWDLQEVAAAWPNPARYEHAAALSRDVADLVRAARCRKTLSRFEARL
jgi:hypothetical protein